MRQGLRGLAVVVLIMLAATACGGGTKVGSAFKNFQGQQAGQRIGAEQPTPTPAAHAAVTKAPAVQQQPTQPKATPKPQQSVLTVQITANGFDPTTARVYQGSIITVTNADSSAHSYTSADGTYDTGLLAPHQSKTFTAGAAGNFQINDRSRNWIIGSLQVIHR